MIPNANKSVRASTASPRTCSGPMYGTVPATCPAAEIGDSIVCACVASTSKPGRASFASPKSNTFTRPSRVTITFAGLRSR